MANTEEKREQTDIVPVGRWCRKTYGMVQSNEEIAKSFFGMISTSPCAWCDWWCHYAARLGQ
jgi:hypothetical protein